MKYAIVITAADGTISVSGPYTSLPAARTLAADIADYSQGVAADVHPMEPPRDTRAEYVTAMRTGRRR